MIRIIILFLFSSYAIIISQQNWTHYLRTSGHGLYETNIDEIIKDAVETSLFGIEVDNDITGRYSSFLNPQKKLATLKELVSKAHQINNHAFVYVAGLECITDSADMKENSFFKDHPDWVQRDINNHPAIFGGGDAFWIKEGDEDVWISPYALTWRNIYMEHIREIANTGIDGIYVDIPYWMTHFEGWEDTWASFDEYTVQTFKEKTGIDARSEVKLGDFSDANFRRWVDFRIETITDFMKEINYNIKKKNPEGITIAEIYPGIGEEAVRVGSDVYELYNVVDVIAHEFDGGDRNAASKDPLDWFSRMIGMYTFKAFAEDKATWMLSYSWNEENKIDPQEPMKNLMLSNVMAGANCWDARGYVMSGSNDIFTRKVIFEWIGENEEKFYKPRKPIDPIGVYFSPKTRNYFADEFIESFDGIMNLLLHSHYEFQIVTPRILDQFKGTILILPDVKCISEDEVLLIKSIAKNGTGLIITGETGKYDISGTEVEQNLIHNLLDKNKQEMDKSSGGEIKYILKPECPGKIYSKLCIEEFNQAAWKGSDDGTKILKYRDEFKSIIVEHFNFISKIKIEASPFLSTQIVNVENSPHIYIANFKGLKSDENAGQMVEKNIKIDFGFIENAKVYYLPFMGNKTELRVELENGRSFCLIPEIIRGGVVWVENQVK